MLGKFVTLDYTPAIYPNGVYEKNVKPLRKASVILILEINGEKKSFEVYKELRKLAYFRCISDRFISLLNDKLTDKVFLLNDDSTINILYFNELIKKTLWNVRVQKFHANK